MQGIAKALRLHGRQLRHAVLQHMNKGIFSWATLISRIQSESPTVIIPHMGLDNITVSEILKAKGEAEAGAVYWCDTGNSVHEAVKHVSIYIIVEQKCRGDYFFIYAHIYRTVINATKKPSVKLQMTVHNVGALVVLKSGDMKQLAGIVTERGMLKSAADSSPTGIHIIWQIMLFCDTNLPFFLMRAKQHTIFIKRREHNPCLENRFHQQGIFLNNSRKFAPTRIGTRVS
jgi:hypothetical protein